MRPGRALLAIVIGIGCLTVWVSWLVMLVIGSLAGLDVVNATVGFVEAIPLGLGLVLVGVLPFGMLCAVAADNDRADQQAHAKDPSPPLSSGPSVRSPSCRRRR